MDYYTILTLLSLLALSLGDPFPDVDAAQLNSRIVGGLPAKEGQFPYQVSLQHQYGHFCGGSVLNENWILTAAHCTIRMKSTFFVFVGVTNLNDSQTTGTKYNFSKIIVHPEYDNNKQYSNDISLIKVKNKIVFSIFVRSVQLPLFNMDKNCLPVVASGWGSKSLGKPISNELQYLKSSVYDHKSCIKRMAQIPFNFPPVNEHHICTYTKESEGFCHGDSGGPIVANGIQVGIVSLAFPCARGYPDVNTNVWNYIDWIKGHIDSN